ncbi:probable ATP-dependent RNA helicase DDX47 [Uloborus diversus]|uniref:probable ATP-dependent RNA helicase DDX47 n=1 Tax=Uloborus diversus TaxID=327109 RepID=UPI00240A8155|nr:probable ATP-dependent RNA helicase DDX47 [Uloborus diversus]
MEKCDDLVIKDNDPVPTENSNEEVTFKSLGVVDVLCAACEQLKWKSPTAIQKEAIPVALAGRDVIGLAETGSGKTGAFAIPVIQALLKTPQSFFALVLTPTRELAFQIGEQFEALGLSAGVKTAVLVGGLDVATQRTALSRNPHIIIATPGRLLDHLVNTKGFSLKKLKFLIMDEADKILDMDFEEDVNKILTAIPRERNTYLYSATMTKKVQKLQRASLTDPVRVEVSKKYQTVEKLLQYYMFIPLKHRDAYLVRVLNDFDESSIIIFCDTHKITLRTALLLRNLGFPALPLYGKLSQEKRLGVLQKFKSKSRSILVATDVASRGLDIPHVDVVINFDFPVNPKEYFHRVGRTARAGREGKAISFVTQYDVQNYLDTECLIGKKLPLYPIVNEEVMVLLETVAESRLHAEKEMEKELERKNKRKHRNEDENSKDVKNRFKKKKKHN